MISIITALITVLDSYLAHRLSSVHHFGDLTSLKQSSYQCESRSRLQASDMYCPFSRGEYP
jgi:hypothetical protein